MKSITYGVKCRTWVVSNGTQRDTYSLDKSYEREMVGGAITLERYYLTSGTLMTVAPGSRKLNYLHNDRLGSTVSISEKPMPDGQRLGAGDVTLVEHKGFDAFGKALDGAWGTSNFGMLNLTTGQNFNQGKRTQRGFTGHEHLDEFALIHMNGRVYDYNLGRFFGVDPFIQFPANSQSLNPYGYLMNNPLSGTDPTGYAGEHICGGGKPECDAVITGAKNIASFLVAFTGAATGNGGLSGLASVLKKHSKAGDADSLEGISLRSVILPTTDRFGKEGAPRSLGDNVEGAAQELTNQGLQLMFLERNIDRVKSGAAVTNFLVNSYVNYKTDGQLEGNSPVFLETPQFNIDKKGLLGASIAEMASMVIPAEKAVSAVRGVTTVSKTLFRVGEGIALRQCFAAGTLILTDKGLIPIENIKVGDMVAARDHVTGETWFRSVITLISNPENAVLDLILVDSLGVQEHLSVTSEHPFMTNNGWKTVAELSPNDVIQSFDGRLLRMNSRVDEGRRVRTYNFEVEGAHTYFVGRSGAWVHNICLSATAKRALQKIDNIIANNAFEHDFMGAWKDLRGIPSNGQHLKEMQNSIIGLKDSIASLKGTLNNPLLTDEARGLAQESVDNAQSVLDRMKRVANGGPWQKELYEPYDGQ